MVGVILTLISSFFREVFAILSKKEFKKKKIGVFSVIVLGYGLSWVFFVGLGLFKNSFYIDPASYPTLFLHISFELIQLYIMTKALLLADRSTYTFLKSLTIPLLLLVDVMLLYSISTNQIIGISLVMFSIILLAAGHGLNKKGAMVTIVAAINSVFTISLFKYNISHFNNVESEMAVVMFFVVVTFLILSVVKEHQNFKSLFLTKKHIVESLAAGVSQVVYLYSYMFAPASIITAAKRAADIMFGIISGKVIFKEKKTLLKIFAFIIILAGMVLLAI